MKPQTQIQSYLDLQEQVSGKRAAVYNALKLRDMTLFELKKFLGWEINSVSGRVTELQKLGVIEENGTRRNPETGKLGIVWAVKQLSLI